MSHMNNNHNNHIHNNMNNNNFMNELGIDPYDSFHLRNKVEAFMIETINQIRNNSRSPEQLSPNHQRLQSQRYRSRSPDYSRRRDRSRSPEYKRDQIAHGSNRIVNNSMRNWRPQQSSVPKYIPQQPEYVPQQQYVSQQPEYVPQQPEYLPQQYVSQQSEYVHQQYVSQQPEYVPQQQYVSRQPEYVQSEQHMPHPQQSMSQVNESDKDRMGHFIITEYKVVADFVLSVRSRKRKDIMDARMNEAVSAIQRTIAISNNSNNIKIPDIFSYEIYVMHISKTLDFGTRIFWCPSRHSYVFKEAGFVPRDHPILKMINYINKKTGDILQNIEREWSERNQSWTLRIGLIGKYNEEQKTKLQKLISQLKATSIATNK